jgi:hypothetical protein
MELNIVSFGYLFLRLAPFVLVSFFSLSSIFNQDFKGLVYLVGLLFACFINIMVGNVMTFLPSYELSERPEICNMISIGQTDISRLPLGQAVFGYTFAYLLVSIITYDFVNQNIPTLVFFPLLISFDILWNIRNSCYTLWQLLASLVFAGLFGWLWGYLVDSTNSANLQYFAGVNNKEVCSKPSASTFKCAVYQNGQLLSKNFSAPTNSN